MNPISDTETKRMVMELYDSWFGVEGTEDKGAICDLKEMRLQLDELRGLTTWRKVHTWAIGSIVTVLLATLSLLIAHIAGH